MQYWKTLLWVLCPLSLAAQDHTDSMTREKVYAITFQKGAVFIHKSVVAGAGTARPETIGLEYATQRLDYNSYSICKTYLRTGFSLAFTDFHSPVVGKSLIGSFFIEPVYRIGNRFQFQFRCESGISYFTSPYNVVSNKSNQSYSTHLNTYLHIGAGAGIRLSRHFTTTVNGNIHHISNADFKQPNSGLNWLMFSGSLLYYPYSNHLPKYKNPPAQRIHSKPTADVGFMVTPGQGYHHLWLTKRNYMLGLFGQVSMTVSKINALTGGAEMTYDRYRDDSIAPRNNSRPALKAGLNLGNEFLLGKVIVSQQLGIYISRHPAFYSTLYHRWGIRYQLGPHWFAGVCMKVHKEVADLIDLRLQYRF
ncbi:MAG: acyloxyacyl hydrolase [Sphingobacteriales bacterium]|nr:acyloxyacyl hydrolase [Sphingobacteriales bacterium]